MKNIDYNQKFEAFRDPLKSKLDDLMEENMIGNVDKVKSQIETICNRQPYLFNLMYYGIQGPKALVKHGESTGNNINVDNAEKISNFMMNYRPLYSIIVRVWYNNIYGFTNYPFEIMSSQSDTARKNPVLNISYLAGNEVVHNMNYPLQSHLKLTESINEHILESLNEYLKTHEEIPEHVANQIESNTESSIEILEDIQEKIQDARDNNRIVTMEQEYSQENDSEINLGQEDDSSKGMYQ